MFLVLYKIACIVLFAFFPDAEYAWLLVIVLIFGSFFNYYSCKQDRPYYNEMISLLWNMTNAVYFWVNCVLLLCMLLKDTSFSGGVQLIGLGIPLIVIVEYISPHPRLKTITKEFSRCESGDDCESYLRYLAQIIQNRHEKESSTTPSLP